MIRLGLDGIIGIAGLTGHHHLRIVITSIDIDIAYVQGVIHCASQKQHSMVVKEIAPDLILNLIGIHYIVHPEAVLDKLTLSNLILTKFESSLSTSIRAFIQNVLYY